MSNDKLLTTRMSEKVISAINGELTYQTTLQDANRADNIDYGVAGQLVTLAVYAREAEIAWVKNKGVDKSLDALRKVAAIAIRALEQYGCPTRE